MSLPAYSSVTQCIFVFFSIFVPSTRNTLGDILCGRTAALSPKRPRKRSESRSPHKGKGNPSSERDVPRTTATAAQILDRRTSPRKPSHKLVYDEQLEAHLEPTTGMWLVLYITLYLIDLAIRCRPLEIGKGRYQIRQETHFP